MNWQNWGFDCALMATNCSFESQSTWRTFKMKALWLCVSQETFANSSSSFLNTMGTFCFAASRDDVLSHRCFWDELVHQDFTTCVKCMHRDHDMMHSTLHSFRSLLFSSSHISLLGICCNLSISSLFDSCRKTWMSYRNGLFLIF